MLCAIDFSNLHTILRSLYDEMMPLCSDMAGVAQAIAGLGALFYVAYRIWQSLARAEPIDVFPLLRPFVIGFCIMFFPSVVLGTINAVMSPIVQGTASMLEGQTLDMQKYREEKDRLEYEQMIFKTKDEEGSTVCTPTVKANDGTEYVIGPIRPGCGGTSIASPLYDAICNAKSTSASPDGGDGVLGGGGGGGAVLNLTQGKGGNGGNGFVILEYKSTVLD